jgi:hypothetical protein
MYTDWIYSFVEIPLFWYLEQSTVRSVMRGYIDGLARKSFEGEAAQENPQ